MNAPKFFGLATALSGRHVVLELAEESLDKVVSVTGVSIELGHKLAVRSAQDDRRDLALILDAVPRKSCVCLGKRREQVSLPNPSGRSRHWEICQHAPKNRLDRKPRIRANVNLPGFTGGQNSRRIARYGTDIKEEDLEAVFT